MGGGIATGLDAERKALEEGTLKPPKRESKYDRMSEALNRMREYQDSRVGALSPGPRPGRPSSREIYLRNRKEQVGW